MADTPDLDLNILIRVDRAEGLSQTLASLDVIPRVDRSRVEIVLADASDDTDAARQIETFVSSGRYPMVAVLREAWATPAGAWNAALRRGRGVWVLRLTAGDDLVCDPLPFLERHPAATSVQFAVDVLHGRRRRRHRPRKLTEQNCLRWLTAGNPIVTEGIIFRRAFATHPFDETMAHLHEWAYWLLNRAIFDRPAWERKAVIASTRSGTHDLDHVDAAVERVRIAERMANRLRFQLPRSLKNNLKLQQACGLRLQGKRAPLFGTLLRLPADAGLYVRGLGYLLLGRMLARR